MAQIREIRKRMVAVGNIQRITKTMQMIATAKFTSALQRAQATKPYTAKVQSLVAEVAAAAGDVYHPLISPPSPAVKKVKLLVITTDRGFCGAYNNNVLREASNYIKEQNAAGNAVSLETSGKKAVGFFNFQRIPIEHKYFIGDKPQFEEVERIADNYIEAFGNGEFDAVSVIYMRYISNARQEPELMPLLPLKPPTTGEGASQGDALYDFSPSSAELLGDLLPRAVKTMLFQAFNDSVVSEQIMKMIAMKGATENAKELGKSLRRDFNRARQSQITTELMEVISGAAALE